MKGIFHSRPSLPKYRFTWDIRNLLDYYRSKSSNNNLNLKALTFNPLQPSVAFLYTPSKHQKSFRFSDVFKGYRKATPGCNGLRQQPY